MSALEQLGEFVATYRPDDAIRQKVPRHIADILGAWIAATATEEGKALIRHGNARAELSDRVAMHCALARLSEVDDIHLAAMITPGAIVIPAALTISAHMRNVNAHDLIAAIVVGYEAMIRLGVTIDGPSVLYRGIWPSYFAAPFGVAAVYARLAKLDAKHAAHALALALTSAAPSVGHHSAVTTARWITIGNSAARGIDAVHVAQSGFTSDLKLADGDFFKKVFDIAPNSTTLGGGLGAIALLQVSFKPWCAARQTMPATQALKEIMDQGVTAGSIDAIDVSVLPQHLKMIDHGITLSDRISYLTSVQYQMTTAALSPHSAYCLSAPIGALPAPFVSFMARINVRADKALSELGYPSVWPARVEIRTVSEGYERRVIFVPGDPDRPLNENDLKQKFCRLVAPIVGEGRANALHARGMDALNRSAASLIRDVDEIIATHATPAGSGATI